tara:strand:+ start:1496 stop:2629 length:1134 start_codon:yes stop_codon:yes gene_type:complete
MAETDKKIEAMEQEVSEVANPQADAPKKNAVAAEPTHLKNDAQDLGPAVVKPTDSNPDASKSTSQVSGDAQQKSAGAADAMPKLSGHNTKLEGKDTDEKSLEDKEKAEMAHADDKDKKDMKASYKKEESELDIKADVDALIGDSDLSEEFKQKAATIFETAIKAKVKEESQRLQGEYETKLKEDTEAHKADVVEKVDSYLNYVVEEWMQENKIAIERGIKGEIAEDFIGGLKKLFEDHYIDVPDEKYNVLEDQASKIEDLEKKLNEEIEKNVTSHKTIGELKRDDIAKAVSENLTDVEKEKFNKLAEEVEYSNEEDFTTKVTTIKESYFGKQEAKSNDIDDVAVSDGSTVEPADLTNSMAAYSAAISKTKDVKLSIK